MKHLQITRGRMRIASLPLLLAGGLCTWAAAQPSGQGTPEVINEQHFVTGGEVVDMLVANGATSAESASLAYFSGNGALLRTDYLPLLMPSETRTISIAAAPPGTVALLFKSPISVTARVLPTNGGIPEGHFDGTRHSLVPSLFDSNVSDREVMLWNYQQSSVSVSAASMDSQTGLLSNARFELAPSEFRLVRLADLLTSADGSRIFLARIT